MPYVVLFSSKGDRAFRKLPRDIQKESIAYLQALAIDPRPHGIKKMSDGPYYRARLGDYRIIYDICDKKAQVLVINIGHRENIYRKR
jgi:mRNA interferase RelE/StbE